MNFLSRINYYKIAKYSRSSFKTVLFIWTISLPKCLLTYLPYCFFVSMWQCEECWLKMIIIIILFLIISNWNQRKRIERNPSTTKQTCLHSSQQSCNWKLYRLETFFFVQNSYWKEQIEENTRWTRWDAILKSLLRPASEYRTYLTAKLPSTICKLLFFLAKVVKLCNFNRFVLNFTLHRFHKMVHSMCARD